MHFSFIAFLRASSVLVLLLPKPAHALSSAVTLHALSSQARKPPSPFLFLNLIHIILVCFSRLSFSDLSPKGGSFSSNSLPVSELMQGVSDEQIIDPVVRIVRKSRDWNDLRRGSSIRGAIDFASILQYLDKTQPKSWLDAGIMALSTKVELEDGVDKRVEDVVKDIIHEVLADQDFF